MTVAEALAARGASSVVGLTGRVTKAFPVKTGMGTRGPWSHLDFEIQDATGTAKVIWWSPTMEDHRALQGQVVTLSARREGDKLRDCFVDVSDKGTRIKANGEVVTISQQQASFSPPAAAPGFSAAPAVQNGPMPLSKFLETARRISAYINLELGITEQEAATATLNTALIAISNGRVVVDELPDNPEY